MCHLNIIIRSDISPNFCNLPSCFLTEALCVTELGKVVEGGGGGLETVSTQYSVRRQLSRKVPDSNKSQYNSPLTSPQPQY